jgi:hypothetical protein
MALATALAAARSWSPRHIRVTWMVLGALSLSAPAVAVEQVYIWRDQSGAVRFSPVQMPERHAADGASNTGAACERDAAAAAVVVTETTARRGN